MSASYSAVGWNRQKKIYDSLIAAFSLPADEMPLYITADGTVRGSLFFHSSCQSVLSAFDRILMQY